MRFLLKVSIPVETGNALAKSGKLGSTIGAIMESVKPEAAYFAEFDGKRTGIIVVDVSDASQIPAIAEPFFIGLNAAVEFHAAMIPEDLMKAGPSIDAAAKKFG